MNPLSLDLPSLHLVRLVAHHRAITPAAEAAGISQSALSRQLQSIEAQLGFQLFERTTRSLRITAAAESLLRDTEQIPMILDGALRRIREEILKEEKIVHVGVSRSISLAHIPGIFHSQLNAEQRIVVSHPTGPAALQGVEHGKLDLAVITQPLQLPPTVEVTHRISDEFIIIAPSTMAVPGSAPTQRQLAKWAPHQSWLLPPPGSHVRRHLERWMTSQNIHLSADMELDSFDLMTQLVSMKMGVAFIPRRALSIFQRKSLLQRIKLRSPLVRELVIVTQKRSITPRHVTDFIDKVLFS